MFQKRSQIVYKMNRMKIIKESCDFLRNRNLLNFTQDSLLILYT